MAAGALWTLLRMLPTVAVPTNGSGSWFQCETQLARRIRRAAMSPAAFGGRTVGPVTEEDF
jgi:hypothetical protein